MLVNYMPCRSVATNNMYYYYYCHRMFDCSKTVIFPTTAASVAKTPNMQHIHFQSWENEDVNMMLWVTTSFPSYSPWHELAFPIIHEAWKWIRTRKFYRHFNIVVSVYMIAIRSLLIFLDTFFEKLTPKLKIKSIHFFCYENVLSIRKKLKVFNCTFILRNIFIFMIKV